MIVNPANRASWGARGLMAWISTVVLLGMSGCSGTPTPSLSPKPVKLARAMKIAVIRLGEPTIAEPVDSDIADGVKYAGVDPSSFTITTFDAKGDLAAVSSLVDAAVNDGADLLITLLPETTVAVASKDRKIPLVFEMTGDPMALGLGKDDSDHQPNLTGAYTSFQESLIVPIARGCLSKAHKLGILFNPDDRFSVMHKDVILRTPWWGPLEPVTAEFHSESEVPAAVRALVEKKAEGVILVSGIGGAAKAAIEEARRAKVPVFGFKADHARAGAIVAREPKLRWGGFEVGRRAGRVLKGESLTTIPFAQGVDYVTYVNTASSKDIRVPILGALMRMRRGRFEGVSRVRGSSAENPPPGWTRRAVHRRDRRRRLMAPDRPESRPIRLGVSHPVRSVSCPAGRSRLRWPVGPECPGLQCQLHR